MIIGGDERLNEKKIDSYTVISRLNQQWGVLQMNVPMIYKGSLTGNVALKIIDSN